ncbi:MAG: methyltransferase domain-containing protein [Bacteroidota bacterium]
MLKQWVYPLYRFSHDFLFASRNLNPIFPKKHGGKAVKAGHVSDEHLENPDLDTLLEQGFRDIGVKVDSYTIDPKGYQEYLKLADYPADYYGGGLDPQQNFTEKTLEHYVSLDFLQLGKESTFIDIAACTSPFSQILHQKMGVAHTFQQDLIYPKGINGNKIGGWAHELYLEDESVDAVSLHCSLEHFEGNSDTLFFQELERVLKPGGRAVILPFYLAHEFSNHVDPAYNLLKNHRPPLDEKARLRYCNWYQFFSRHYDPAALKRRVLDQAPRLELNLYRVSNFKEVYKDSYLRWIGVFEKK